MTVAAELAVNGTQVSIVDTLELGWSNGDDVADYPDLTASWLDEHRIPLADWARLAEMDEVIVEAAARLAAFDYDRRKADIAELLGGIGKRTLDHSVKQARHIGDEPHAEPPSTPFSGEEPWPEPVDGKDLVERIQKVIQSHVILTRQQALAIALWILMSYTHKAFRVCPRLLVSSPEKRCGKTTLLETIQAMCCRGLAVANISAAALFRALAAWVPTLLIDEADTFLNSNDELRGILNSGHTKATAYVIRTVGDDHQPMHFSTFAPIAIGMIKRPPETLLDRSIVIGLQRKLGADYVTPLPLEAEAEYQPIRQQCRRWVEDNVDDLHADRELTPADIDNDRARDNWTPLMAIAKQCGLLDEAQAACRELTLTEDASLTVDLLADIQQIFREEGKDKLPSKTVVKKLLAMEERPWSEYANGRPLTQNKLADLLSAFGVRTVQARDGAKVLRHYHLTDLQPLFDRYLATEKAAAAID
jgi:putative DNA primase/helicase